VFTNDDPLNAEDPLGSLACSGGGGKSSCVKQIPTIKVSIKIKATGNPNVQLASDSNEPYSVSAKVSVTYTNAKVLRQRPLRSSTTPLLRPQNPFPMES